jgi:hypothetical protein
MVADQSDWPWRLNRRFACTRSLEMNETDPKATLREFREYFASSPIGLT